jgi:excisionase family DNA binding protein
MVQVGSFADCEEAVALLRKSTMNPTEFAAASGVGYKTVMRWITDGKLPAIRLGREVYVHRDALKLS